MGSPLSPVIANIYMEFFENLALETSPLRPTLWLRYVDDTFVSWSHAEDIKTLLDHINALRPTIKFTMEIEENNELPFLDVLVKRTESGISTTVYKKPTHTGLYLNYESNHPACIKNGLVKTLTHRAAIISSSMAEEEEELYNIRQQLTKNSYPPHLIKRKEKTGAPTLLSDALNDESRLLPSPPPPTIQIPYVSNVSESIKRICHNFGVRTIFNRSTNLRSILTKIKPTSSTILNKKNCIYEIPCLCGKVYTGESGRPLKVRIEEHKKAVTRGELDKSKMAIHVWKEKGDHNPLWNNTRVIDTERGWKQRKIKEAAHIAMSANCISQTSAEFSPMWFPLLTGRKGLPSPRL